MRGVSEAAGYVRRHHVGLLALIVALSGTAYAATKLPPKSVGPKQIKTGAVTAKKIRPGAIGSDAVLDDSLGGADINESTLQGIDAATLGGEDLASLQALANLGSVGRSGDFAQCDDNAHNLPFSPCGSVEVNVPQSARLLVIMSGAADGVALDDTTGPGSADDSTTKANGQCVVLLDGKGPIAGSFSDLRDTGVDSFSVTVVTDPVSPGSHTLTAGCNEFDGDLDYGVGLTAVSLSAD